MNETLEAVDKREAVEHTKNTTDRQKQALELIECSAIPDVLKDHFSDMIRILGKDTSIDKKAAQILDIADELQLAKRTYLDENKLENDPTADLLISEIVKIYWQ